MEAWGRICLWDPLALRCMTRVSEWWLYVLSASRRPSARREHSVSLFSIQVVITICWKETENKDADKRALGRLIYVADTVDIYQDTVDLSYPRTLSVLIYDIIYDIICL